MIATAFKPKEHAYQKYHYPARLNRVQRFSVQRFRGLKKRIVLLVSLVQLVRFNKYN
jgi:hypothetical protein